MVVGAEQNDGRCGVDWAEQPEIATVVTRALTRGAPRTRSEWTSNPREISEALWVEAPVVSPGFGRLGTSDEVRRATGPGPSGSSFRRLFLPRLTWGEGRALFNR